MILLPRAAALLVGSSASNCRLVQSQPLPGSSSCEPSRYSAYGASALAVSYVAIRHASNPTRSNLVLRPAAANPSSSPDWISSRLKLSPALASSPPKLFQPPPWSQKISAVRSLG